MFVLTFILLSSSSSISIFYYPMSLTTSFTHNNYIMSWIHNIVHLINSQWLLSYCVLNDIFISIVLIYCPYTRNYISYNMIISITINKCLITDFISIQMSIVNWIDWVDQAQQYSANLKVNPNPNDTFEVSNFRSMTAMTLHFLVCS